MKEKPILKFIDDDGEDVVEKMHESLQSGTNKDQAVIYADGLNDVLHECEMDEGQQQGMAHIIACVQLWEVDDWIDLSTCNLFLKTDWYDQYPEQIESFLVMLYSLGSEEFMDEVLKVYPYLKDDFPSLHQAYLAYIVYPEREEYYDSNHFMYYNKLKAAQKLYTQK